MLAGIASAMPNVPMIGNTYFTGVITPKGFITGDDGFVGMMAMVRRKSHSRRCLRHQK